ncbi:MAG TPA: glutamate synthase-related protein [Syntrophorhabdaceae bacterium]|nr:glutamate synthase-related protein [Syntrophorhabdaceae bacterium]HOT41737.1 glutamate synthase-related protein [Syntrophorhabdaceae bacterium]HPC67352.1 glutamate synthase-related protein [Syntrophorhabdaceae bacterium]HQE81094.1 glutamate synthase-related protein [Syntrophorhabdaceae bacterium]HQH42327.1 glutamate synthase-related protein [Syntrophorhabdaceae bacterium]
MNLESEPNQLTLKDFPYIVQWKEDRCKRCGQCTSICPVGAIKPSVKMIRTVESEGMLPQPKVRVKAIHIIEQIKDMEHYCTGCAMCQLVCPNEAIEPVYNPQNRFFHFKNTSGEPYRRGGRRNDPNPSTLDRIKFTRISMLTDPALDAGRHEFRIRTYLGRLLQPHDLPLVSAGGRIEIEKKDTFIPPVREIFPVIIGSMSIGALSPPMWEGLAMGVAYLNEVEGIPVVMATGEGGVPSRLLKSRYLKYFILQIASGYFGWDEIIHSLPYMVEDPAAIEIKYGQGAKPGDGGLLMAQKVIKLIAKIRGVPEGVDLASPPTHQTKYSIEEAVAKMIQSMSMAFGFRVPVYPKISGTKTALAVLNNLARNPYAGALAIDGEDGGTGAAYNVSLDKMGHPIASNIRDCYLELVKQGKQNELPLIAGGGIGKKGNLAANTAALIMLGASAIQVGKYIMQATAGCLGDELNRCNICNTGKCPRGIATQDPKLYRRLDSEKVAERLVEVFRSCDVELKKIFAPLGRSTELPIGMSDALGSDDAHMAERLGIAYVC